MEKIVKVYDLVNKSWLSDSASVVYRNSLLGHLFPNVEFAIGDCLSMLIEKEPNTQGIAELLDAGFEDFQIVGASGSRKHGRILYARGASDYFTRFFGSNANAINYGSNLTTECKKIVDTPVKLLVVKDGEYSTGDCHGKCSAKFAHLLTDSIANPFQFRAANLDPAWCAKGTIAYSYKVSRSKYDLVLPESCFKGNKVKSGEYNVNLTVGLVFASPAIAHEEKRHDWRKANMSYSVVQFLPWEAVEADILPTTQRAVTEINAMMLNPLKLAEYLADGDEESTSTYQSRIEKIVAADIHGQLASHPWVIKCIQEMFQQKLVKLATAGAAKFNSSMVMPDENLPDDCVCIPGIADGEEIIVFPYPCRWRYDIKVWRNVALESWQNFQGIIVGNQHTLMKLGRDTDGDFLMWLPSLKLPNVAIAIKEFGEPPIDQAGIKPEKKPVVGTLGQVAVMSMSNDTGLITWLISKANALGMEDYVNQLVPQLQAAVDSLKGAAPPDQKLLAQISKAMKDETVAWLKEYKSSGVYMSYPMTDDGRADTVSRLVREVNKLWIAPTFRMSKYSVFAPLFPEPNANWLSRAKIRCREYSAAMMDAGAEERNYPAGKVPQHIADACDAKRKAVIKRFESLLNKCDAEQRIQAMSAFWHAKHNCNSVDQHSAYICFLVGLDEICRQLQTLHLKKLHVLGRVWADPEYQERVLEGETIAIKLVPHTNNYWFAQDNKGKFLGCLSVNDCPPILLDCWFEAIAHTRFDKKNHPSWTELVVSDNF